MWNNFSPTEESFQMDEGPEVTKERQRHVFEKKIEEHGLWNGVETIPGMDEIAESWEENEQDDVLSEILHNLSLQDEEAGAEDQPSHSDQLAWFPYNSKLEFLLDTIDNLPRLRISSSIMKVVIWLLQEVGVKNVPSFNKLRETQHQIRKGNGVPTVSWKSPKGNAFSFNDPRAIVANDWMNPLVRPHIRRYPVIPSEGVISEVWHARKWREDCDRHILSPMYDSGDERHFFIDEPAELADGGLIIPLRWLEDEGGKIYADAWEIKVEQSIGTINDEKIILVEAEHLRKSMMDLTDEKRLPAWSSQTIDAGHLTRMPNPLRALAEGDPIYTSFIDIFGDDVSGNKSKSWNKHWNIYFSHRNLPRKLLNHTLHIHFISTSTHATVPEQFEGVKHVIDEPVKVCHPTTGKITRFRIFCNCEPGDNPAQSEVSGHIGGNGNLPCRKCGLGGSQKEKETDTVFEAFFHPGELRSAKQNLECVEAQLKKACLGIASHVSELQTNTGIKDAFTQHWIEDLIARARAQQKLEPHRSNKAIQADLMIWVKEHRSAILNPFLTMKGTDIALDTPVEILHTILLGVVKYGWFGTHDSWNPTNQKVYSTRLQSTDSLGLSLPPIRASYIMQYANSLIGRQLKTVVQVNAFHVFDLVNALQFSLIKAIGELSALLWFPEIRNLEQYLSDVEVAAANVLDIAALIDPTKIVAKLKYHLLVHLRADIIRFGPLVGVATEVFESFNAIFRYCSILSNHLAPSRDIAHQLAEQETVKHLLSGWVQAGASVRDFIKADRVLQTLVGWIDDSPKPLGFVKLPPEKREKDRKRKAQEILPWAATAAVSTLNAQVFPINATLQWHYGSSVIARSQDECVKGSWVFAQTPYPGSNIPITGRIVEILQDTTKCHRYIVLDVYHIAAARHNFFGMPILARRFDEKTTILVGSESILFEFNAQHNCKDAACKASGRRKAMQERIESNVDESFIEHKPLDQYLINIHAFHNAHLLREVLPRALVQPIPFMPNRIAHHAAIAKDLRSTQEAKREAATTKAADRKRATELGLGTEANSGSNGQKRKRTKTKDTRVGLNQESGQGSATNNTNGPGPL
ncbi:hypothetical protein CPB83DRAFT_937649 [Crepidotus variabilis]|uniref:Uncharacterized protein n=1 Tax=Crepidotus variabilis TaxID=179855 RepID=A0A9P6JNH1_9AGAR|nr:hypothetical protein CPB83DRAFT_937649 [Crepidotus variabilis]